MMVSHPFSDMNIEMKVVNDRGDIEEENCEVDQPVRLRAGLPLTEDN